MTRVKQLPVKNSKDSGDVKASDSATQKITEHGSESELGDTSRRQRKVMLGEMYDLNQELTEENDFLARKLEEAEGYIRKVELQNGLLTNEINALRI